MTVEVDPNDFVLDGEEDDLDVTCDEMLDAIARWRERGRADTGLAKLFKAAETLQQEIMAMQENVIVLCRRAHPLPPNRSDAARCPCCAQNELPLYVVDTKCLPANGWLTPYSTFNPAGPTYLTNVHCPACQRTYPLAAAEAVELDSEEQSEH